MSKTAKTTPSAAEHRPVLFITVGRQRVGKTTFMNVLIQALRQQGANITIWNADQLNTTHNLAVFHADALQPRSSDFEDGKAWLEEQIEDQMEGQYDVMLDVGGGETPLSRLVREVPIVKSAARQGIRVVLAHVIGPDQADVDYLKHYMKNDLFAPEATLIVLNGGLVLSGRSIAGAFAEVREHTVIKEAIARRARLAVMPALSCMAKVTDRGLTFDEAAEGVSKGKLGRMSFLDQERVAIWWERAIPEFISTIPAEWLPATATSLNSEEAPLDGMETVRAG
ncbi:hypothetical protein HN018_23440 (plasmid) [Lichenicola cladoniae]|uniref:CobQ/CobB/MinD/ParA nucleotide binding domain-containing protein n=1 Tax=Lichenicola cladoniae TaxID=1484109 RepID=A0A6M8HXS8_9PROT|nr:hypothetical protein [Lichenicola cladoniae]NPD66326.1 hypothetical protein [Acetobacteraceae bacterium]QKE93140.1 hypothetical protein HN018_23440 [Lichenicola cladoniae]